ncbi:MAG: hypothetical protein JWO07_776 [Candidatus Saccharibacteria bacterium]|nr:hypothetical protein [Candidatus Saccharibacteria bacterium]
MTTTTPVVQSEGPSGLQVTTPSSTASVSGTPTSTTSPVTVAPPEPPKASATDVQQALASAPIADPVQPATKDQTDKLVSDVGANLGHHPPGGDNGGGQPGQSGQGGPQQDPHHWDGHVRPFQPDWISYDHSDHHGPVMCNPYHDREIHVSYWYQGAYYVRVIPPMANINIDVDVSVTTFTSVEYGIGSYSNVVVGVSTGYFHTWNYVPQVYVNVQITTVVNVNLYPRPFVVRRVTDCGYDPVQRRQRFILDDGYTVWGTGVRNTAGVLTGINLEESATLPGTPNASIVAGPPQNEEYQRAAAPRLVSDEKPQDTGISTPEVVGITLGAVTLVAMLVGAGWLLVRRRTTP